MTARSRDASAIAARRSSSSSSSSIAAATSLHRSGRVEHPARDAVDDRLGSSARVPGDLWRPARRGLDEDDAEPFLLETAPPRPACHREHVGTAVEQRQVVVGHSSEEAHRGAEVNGEAAETPFVAPAPGDREDEARARPGQAAATARMATSNPLRGTRREIETTSSALAGIPKRVRAALRSAAVSGRNRSTSTPGGTTVTGSADQPHARPRGPRTPPPTRRVGRRATPCRAPAACPAAGRAR